MARISPVLSLLAITVLAVAGCDSGSDGSDASAQPTAPATTAPTTGAAIGPAPGDLQIYYTGELIDPTAVADSSGNEVTGLINSGGGGKIKSVQDADGNYFLRFPGGTCTTAPCPQAIINPDSTDSLVPAGDEPFVFGADIRLTQPPSHDAGMNVVQFGSAQAGVGQWKMQVDYGRPSCRWSDGTNVVLIEAGEKGYQLDVDKWYRVLCLRRSSSRFELRVDDPATGAPILPPRTATGLLTDIVPKGEVNIGGKRIKADQSDKETDQFHGDLDNIEFGHRLP